MAGLRVRRSWLGIAVVVALTGVTVDTRLPTPPLRVGHVPALADTVDVYVADIEAFWERRLLATYGLPFEPVADIIGYRTSEPSTLPPCNGSIAPTAAYARNAFYCAQEDSIVYDAERLLPDLHGDFGAAAVGVLLAHEYAHAIQERAGVKADELQADCLAGAWAGRAGAQRSMAAFRDGDVSGIVRAYRTTADPSPDANPKAYGTVLDRVTAFSVGFRGDAKACVGYRAARRVGGRASPPERTQADLDELARTLEAHR